ncbi:MAG: hypothetical protein I3273_06055 [Candidatus Moeniiplasma glomeromycotorum]|nr:hypothetical protein [Candidatus Moeniiplasma glomeromycotorum]MCE8168104.1 hypothetical protein [Candidatus Moeniiplasma glomeromycotorum]MCE8169648.1 hypothetical protein [Candidatus Moeniiplasma glomeromycotorum]
MGQTKKLLSSKLYKQENKEIKLNIIRNDGWKEWEVVEQISSTHQLSPVEMLGDTIFDLICLLRIANSLSNIKKIEFEIELVNKKSMDMIINLSNIPIVIVEITRVYSWKEAGRGENAEYYTKSDHKKLLRKKLKGDENEGKVEMEKGLSDKECNIDILLENLIGRIIIKNEDIEINNKRDNQTVPRREIWCTLAFSYLPFLYPLGEGNRLLNINETKETKELLFSWYLVENMINKFKDEKAHQRIFQKLSDEFKEKNSYFKNLKNLNDYYIKFDYLVISYLENDYLDSKYYNSAEEQKYFKNMYIKIKGGKIDLKNLENQLNSIKEELQKKLKCPVERVICQQIPGTLYTFGWFLKDKNLLKFSKKRNNYASKQ